MIPRLELFRSKAKSLIKAEKSVGDSESPCLTPEGQSKYSVSQEVKIIRDLGFVYILEIALYILPQIPILESLKSKSFLANILDFIRKLINLY